MAYTKLQGRRAIDVYPADGIKVPAPSDLKVSGANTSVVASELVDSGADFLAANVRKGDIVHNTTSGAAAKVTGVSATALTLSADIFTASPQDYSVYSSAGDDGPVLYVGGGGVLSIITVGGDSVTLTNVANGSFIPVMVFSVEATGTTCSDIIAFW